MERRVHKRVKLFATARFGRHEDNKVFFGSVVDVSYSGVFIMTAATVKPGERIWIECTIDGQNVKVHGTVARTRIVSHPQLVTYSKGGIGVKVENMHPHILNFIDGRLNQEAKFI